MDTNPEIDAVPFQAVHLIGKMAKKWEKRTNFSKYNKNPFVSQINRPKQCKDEPSKPKKPKKQSTSGSNVEKKNPDLVHDEASFNFSKVPPPICSCSGFARRCYKYAPGGWQSSCCTYSLSEYPLPKSPLKPGKRISGRKMTCGAYRKLLCALAKTGHDLAEPVDLRDHWAKLGTNKFVTFK